MKVLFNEIILRPLTLMQFVRDKFLKSSLASRNFDVVKTYLLQKSITFAEDRYFY